MSRFFDRLTAGAEPNGFSEASDAVETSEEKGGDAAAVTPREVKEVVQELLRFGYLEELRKPELFRRAMVHEQALQEVLEPLDLRLRLYTHRGVALLTVGKQEEADGTESDVESAWSHPLVRRQRLTLEQSLVVALLRQAFVIHEQEAGIGQSAARVALDDLLPLFLTYFDDSGSDARNESRLAHLLDQLKAYGIVSELDKNQELTVRPLIVHLANPESLEALLATLKDKRQTAAS